RWRYPARQGGPALAAMDGEHAGIEPVGLGQAQGAGEGTDLAAIGAMGRDGEFGQHAQEDGLMAAGGLAHGKPMVPKGSEGGRERSVSVDDRQGSTAEEVVKRHAVLSDVETEHGLDWNRKLGHDEGPAL